MHPTATLGACHHMGVQPAVYSYLMTTSICSSMCTMDAQPGRPTTRSNHQGSCAGGIPEWCNSPRAAGTVAVDLLCARQHGQQRLHTSISTPSRATLTCNLFLKPPTPTCCCLQPPPLPPLRLPPAERLVAVGDLHGDLGKAQRAFRLAGLTNDHDHWVGGNTVCVQVGSGVAAGQGWGCNVRLCTTVCASHVVVVQWVGGGLDRGGRGEALGFIDTSPVESCRLQVCRRLAVTCCQGHVCHTSRLCTPLVLCSAVELGGHCQPPPPALAATCPNSRHLMLPLPLPCNQWFPGGRHPRPRP
jgi:hypothetical protein